MMQTILIAGIFGVFALLATCAAAFGWFIFRPFMTAFLHGTPVTFSQLIGIQLRGNSPALLVNAFVVVKRKFPDITLAEVENAFVAEIPRAVTVEQIVAQVIEKQPPSETSFDSPSYPGELQSSRAESEPGAGQCANACSRPLPAPRQDKSHFTCTISLPPRWVGWTFSAFGTVLLIAGVLFGIESWQFNLSGHAVVGKVIALDSSHSSKSGYVPVVRYQVDGKPYEFRSQVSTSPPRYAIGQDVSVVFQAGAPETGRIKSRFDQYLLTVVLVLVGSGFCGVGIVFLLLLRGRADKPRYWTVSSQS